MLASTAEFIQNWLSQPMAERDIVAGANVLLRLNRNRILHGNIVGNPSKYAVKLEYELKKYLRMHLDQQTCASIAKMGDELMPKVEKVIRQKDFVEKDGKAVGMVGLRDDHDQLPERIRSLYEQNGDIYFKMKGLHGKLKTMASAAPCDRYEYLKVMDELYKQYRENWNIYDNYDPTKEPKQAADAPSPADLAKKVSAARKYISTNVRKLEDANAANDETEAARLMPKIQERIDFLIENQQTFDPDYQQKLVSLGMIF